MTRSIRATTTGAISALALAATTALPHLASAQEVTLRSPDGTVNLSGDLVRFNDESYVIMTQMGELRVSASRVDCIGDSCPASAAPAPAPAPVVAPAEPIVPADRIRVTGSETIGNGLMPLLLEGFAAYIEGEALPQETDEPRTSVTSLVSDGGFGDEIGTYIVSSTGSNAAFEALQTGTADIGMSARRIVPNEARALRDTGAGSMVSPEQEHIIGVDSLVVVTHPDNPVEQLTLEQLGQIYSGVIKNWSEVGGEEADILVIDRPERSGTRDVLAEVFEAQIVATLSPLEVRIANDSNKAAQLVRENENAIGFLGYAFQRGTKAINLVNECRVPMVPSTFAARTEEYPLQRRLYLYNRGDVPQEQVKSFTGWAASPAADGFIGKAGFIGLGIERREQSADSERAQQLSNPNVDPYEAPFMQDMMATMANYNRLSTTFRFGTASSRLDERGQADLQRLIDYLEVQPDGTDVLFVGFTDDVGPFDNNLTLSKQRAQDALDAFKAAAGNRAANLNINATGYGEIAPSGCNITDEGRQINRRVEVWIQSS